MEMLPPMTGITKVHVLPWTDSGNCNFLKHNKHSIYFKLKWNNKNEAEICKNNQVIMWQLDGATYFGTFCKKILKSWVNSPPGSYLHDCAKKYINEIFITQRTLWNKTM